MDFIFKMLFSLSRHRKGDSEAVIKRGRRRIVFIVLPSGTVVYMIEGTLTIFAQLSVPCASAAKHAHTHTHTTING